MSKPSRLEKMVLLATLGVVPFAGITAVVAEGEQNGLDGTCQLNLAAYLLGTMAGVDITLSLLYLHLFIQPLRETIAANEAAMTHIRPAAYQAVAHPTHVITIKDDTSATHPPATLNTALEKVMRTNTYACIATGERDRNRNGESLREGSGERERE